MTATAAPSAPDRRKFEIVGQGVLWAIAAGLTVWLAYLRWHSASVSTPGGDFVYTLKAARDIADGRNPYRVKQYVYPVPLALLLVPFTHARLVTLWKASAAFIVIVPFIALVAFGWLVRGRSAWWLRPIVFGLGGFTLFYGRYYPMTRDLYLGQSDTIVLAAVAVAAVAAARGASGVRGAMIGVAGLVKVWPWLAVVGALQRGVPRRKRLLVGALALALLAPVSALALGWSGFIGFLRNDFDARQQNLVSDSVWSVPQLLFSHTTLAHPVAHSELLRVLVTAVLGLWVLALLVVVLRSRMDGALATWNVVFCVLLLLPISHRQYAMFVLPLLWLWTCRAVEGWGRGRWWVAVAVAVAFALWWLDQTVLWPYNGSSDKITALRYCVPFACDLLACTASVIAGRVLCTVSVPTAAGPATTPDVAAVVAAN